MPKPQCQGNVKIQMLNNKRFVIGDLSLGLPLTLELGHWDYSKRKTTALASLPQGGPWKTFENGGVGVSRWRDLNHSTYAPAPPCRVSNPARAALPAELQRPSQLTHAKRMIIIANMIPAVM